MAKRKSFFLNSAQSYKRKYGFNKSLQIDKSLAQLTPEKYSCATLLDKKTSVISEAEKENIAYSIDQITLIIQYFLMNVYSLPTNFCKIT